MTDHVQDWTPRTDEPADGGVSDALAYDPNWDPFAKPIAAHSDASPAAATNGGHDHGATADPLAYDPNWDPFAKPAQAPTSNGNTTPLYGTTDPLAYDPNWDPFAKPAATPPATAPAAPSPNGESALTYDSTQEPSLDSNAAQAIASALGFDTAPSPAPAPVMPAVGEPDSASLIFQALWNDFAPPETVKPSPQPAEYIEPPAQYAEPAAEYVEPPAQYFEPHTEPPAEFPQPEVVPVPWSASPTADPVFTEFEPEVIAPTERLFASVPPRPEAIRTRLMAGVKITARSLLRQRRRLLLSIIAVAIGVGYLAGSLTLLRRVSNGLAAQAGDGTETADLVVEGSISLDTPLEQVRRLVPDNIVDSIRSIDGVAAAEPRLEATAIVIGSEGDAVVGLGLTERPLGVNWPEAPELNNYELQPGGGPPRAPTDVVLDTQTARLAGVEPGDLVTIATKTSTADYTVTGIVDVGTGENVTQGTTLAIFDTQTARERFELVVDNNAIAIALTPDADASVVEEQIRSILPLGAEVTDGETYSEHRVIALAKSFTLIKALLVGFAGLALAVGAFTVANSMALLFEHRRRGFAMLRLLGASREQLVAAAATEALVAGLIAGVFGLAIGLAVGWGIEQVIAQMGTPLPVAGSAVGWQIPLAAISIGGIVTLLTSLAPARSAASTPPIHAITDGAVQPPNVSVWLRLWTRARRPLLTAVLVAGATYYSTELPIAALGALGGGFVVAFVAAQLPRALSGVVAFATRLALRGSPALRRASSLNSLHARRRIAATTAALLMASAVVTGLAILSSSFVQSIDNQITGTVRADLIVDSGTISRGGLAADLLPELRSISGVSGVSGLRVGRAQVGELPIRVGAMDGASMFDLIDLGLTSGVPDTLAKNEIAISTGTAETTGLDVGDSSITSFENGTVMTLKVIAIYDNDLTSVIGEAIIDTEILATVLPQSIDIVAFVGLDETATDVTLDEIESTADKFGAAGVLKPEELVSDRAEFLRGFARVIQWMLAFTVLLALIGVANTLQLGVNERRKELGLLRAIGATRRQVLRIVMSEAAAMSITGTALGIALGFALAFGTVKGLAAYGFSDYVVPTVPIVAIAVLAIGFGLLGAVVPALRASRIPILEAISDQTHSSDRQKKRSKVSQPKGGASVKTRFEPPVEPPVNIPAPTPTPMPQRPSEVEQPTPSDEPVSSHSLSDEFPTAEESETEHTMAMRCIQCGEDPGAGERCQVCGEHQPVATGGMFSVSPGAAQQQADVEPAAGSGDTVTPGETTGPTAARTRTQMNFDDIADAEIVEDDAEAPAPDQTVVDESVAGASASVPIGSIFQERTGDIPAESPFGRFANDHAPTPSNGRYTTTDPIEAEFDAPHEYTPPPAPPSDVHEHEAPTSFGSGVRPRGTNRSSAPPIQDHHGLASAIGSLSESSRYAADALWMVVGALLQNDEAVHYAVAGTSLGMPTAAVSTDRRVIVVSERRWLPAIEVFEINPDLAIHGRHANGQASLTFSQYGNVVTVDQIHDVPVAVALAEAVTGA